MHSFTTLPYDFATTKTDGGYPFGELILSGNTLYGTGSLGGSSGSGTVFSIFLQPQLTILAAGVNVILSWPTNYTGFTLQSTTNLVSAVWSSNLYSPVTVNDHYNVTNSISDTRHFYRLSQ